MAVLNLSVLPLASKGVEGLQKEGQCAILKSEIRAALRAATLAKVFRTYCRRKKEGKHIRAAKCHFEVGTARLPAARILKPHPRKGTETHSPSLPRASRGRGTAKRWKGRYERPTHLYREKASFAASAPIASRCSALPPSRRGRRIEHYPRKETDSLNLQQTAVEGFFVSAKITVDKTSFS